MPRLALTLALLLAAGCLAPAAPTPRGSDARVLVFDGESQAGWWSPVGEAQPVRDRHAFDVDAGVGFVEANLSYDASGPTAPDIVILLLDQGGRVQCAAMQAQPPKTCAVPVPRNITQKTSWTLEVGAGVGASAPGTRYRATVTLHPESPPAGDPRAGTDASIRFRASDPRVDSFEPTMGVLADGTLFAQMFLHTVRSTDDGRTWQDVAPVTTRAQSEDPMMRADPWTGRVYVDQLTIACSVLAWSDDKGASWTTNPIACGLPVDDHQKLAVGPSPLPSPAAPRVLYYSFYSFQKGVWVARSLDGGLAFTTAPVLTPADGDPANTGPIEADGAGNVYVPLYFCDKGGWVGVGVSHDYGQSFHVVHVSDEKSDCVELDPGLAVDAAGSVYIAFDRPSGVKYAYSTDHGESWSAPAPVNPPSVRAWRHVDVVAGDAGRIAIAYRGTTDSAKPASDVDGWAAWRMYVAFVENASTPAPTLRTALATAPDDIVQRGPICQGLYPPCPGNARNIGDFIDVAVGPDGRVYVVYDDGCRDPCETPAESRASTGRVAVEEAGPRLFAERAPWAKV